jgi:hypothetical protein
MVDIGKRIVALEDWAKYHREWNWLMPVVEKIENTWINGGRPVCNTQSNRVQIYLTTGYQNTDFASEVYEEQTKIKSVYKGVLEFIKWYNENKRISQE